MRTGYCNSKYHKSADLCYLLSTLEVVFYYGHTGTGRIIQSEFRNVYLEFCMHR